MASEVEICNRALQKLGAKRIVSLTDDSINARACNAAFEVVRDALYEDHEWGFTIKRVQLAADATAPAFGKTTSFTLPSDFIRIAHLDQEEISNADDRIIENGKILTNESAPLNVRYVSRVTDPNLMPPLFREALSAELAYQLCEEITQSNTKKADLDGDRKDVIRRAKRSNAIQKPAAEPPTDTWITVRA